MAPLKLWKRQFDHYQRWTRDEHTLNFNSADKAAGGAVCLNCNTPFGVILVAKQGSTLTAFFKADGNAETSVASQNIGIRTFPSNTSKFDVHESVPELVRTNFVFLLEDAQKKRNAAGLMQGARSCLDVSLKHLGESSGSRRDRINNLSKRKIITQAIADWAQTLWKEGSDATHDLDADIERAIEHIEFLKLFFEVAFEMPDRVKKASHQTDEDADNQTLAKPAIGTVSDS